jgi:hypothetical protein
MARKTSADSGSPSVPPKRRRGGQELPDSVQDRPEQNDGYDAAVRGDSTATDLEPEEESEVLDLYPDGRDTELSIIMPEADDVSDDDER